MNGTPKTILQAIDNGVHAYNESTPNNPFYCNEMIETHVKDFLRQKIGAMMLDSDPAVVSAAIKLKEAIGL